MHRCLTIPEIVSIICDFIQEPSRQDQNILYPRARNGLCCLARCCKGLNAHATAALWKKLPSIGPLLKTLPAGTFKKNMPKNQFVVVKPIEPAGLGRFHFYASLVQDLSIIWLPDVTCLTALQFSCNTPLLPHLRSLNWQTLSFTDMQHIMLFLHPGIARLELSIPDPHSVATMSLLPRLHVLCPDISVFHLDGIASFSSEDALRLASAAPTCWPNLRSLHIPHLAVPDMQKIAMLPYLWSLILHSPMDELAPIPTFDALAFSALRALEVQPTSMTYGTNLLVAMTSALNVERFRIMCHDAPRGEAWPALFQAIVHAFNPKTLREVVLEEYGDYEWDESDHEGPRSITYEQLRQITVFSNLAVLSIHCWGGFFVEDDDLLHLAQALPLLETLVLSPGRGEMREYHATIQGLAHLARHCPRLESLHLDFTANDLYYEESLARDVCQRRLTTLGVFFSPIKSARVVAAFLSAIFPNIKSIPSSKSARVFEDDEDEDEEGMEDEEGKIRRMKWRQVNELLPIFRFVRVQESRGRAPRGVGGT
ncbi:hypothetical protein EV121DRAFT_260180, partial [Schizophyllum commune]